MTTHGFSDALSIVLTSEGGFVDDARDPGGATNLGVTARTWHAWSGCPTTPNGMRALTPEKVAPLYKAWFWDKIGGDFMPPALALAVFDFAVNAGPPTAVGILQGIVGARKDSKCGPSTLAAADIYARKIGLAKLVTRFCHARRDFYRQRMEFAIFGKGWLARADRVEREALSWIS